MVKNNLGQRFINIGCGTHPINGWINYDFNVVIFIAKISILRKVLNRLKYIPEGYKKFMDQVVKEDIHFANAGKHLPERDNSVNVIYSSHMLEHLDKEETIQFLKEAKRILKDKHFANEKTKKFYLASGQIHNKTKLTFFRVANNV